MEDVSGSTCETCPAGFFCENGKIEKCPEFTSSTPGSDSEANCVCDPAYYDADTGPAVDCTPCPAGTYGSGLGKDSADQCTSCPQGKFGSSQGETSISSCEDCPVGRYGAGDRLKSWAECVACPNHSGGGHDGAGLTAIEQCTCQAGYYDADGSSLNPSVTCVSCPPGHYGARTGEIDAGNCTACPLGRYKEGAVAITRAEDCIACAVGTYAGAVGLTARSQCRTCPASVSRVSQANWPTQVPQCEDDLAFLLRAPGRYDVLEPCSAWAQPLNDTRKRFCETSAEGGHTHEEQAQLLAACPQSCGVCDGWCADDSSFIDETGRSCAYWQADDASCDDSGLGAAAAAALKTACPLSCGQCDKTITVMKERTEPRFLPVASNGYSEHNQLTGRHQTTAGADQYAVENLYDACKIDSVCVSILRSTPGYALSPWIDGGDCGDPQAVGEISVSGVGDPLFNGLYLRSTPVNAGMAWEKEAGSDGIRCVISRQSASSWVWTLSCGQMHHTSTSSQAFGALPPMTEWDSGNYNLLQTPVLDLGHTCWLTSQPLLALLDSTHAALHPLDFMSVELLPLDVGGVTQLVSTKNTCAYAGSEPLMYSADGIGIFATLRPNPSTYSLINEWDLTPCTNALGNAYSASGAPLPCESQWLALWTDTGHCMCFESCSSFIESETIQLYRISQTETPEYARTATMLYSSAGSYDLSSCGCNKGYVDHDSSSAIQWRCSACAAGKYIGHTHLSAPQECHKCAAGRYGHTVGLSDFHFCTKCPAGFYGTPPYPADDRGLQLRDPALLVARFLCMHARHVCNETWVCLIKHTIIQDQRFGRLLCGAHIVVYWMALQTI